MKDLIGSLTLSLGKFLTRHGMGMRAKLILIFITIKVIPLILLTLLAWRQTSKLGEELLGRSHMLVATANEALSEMGKIAVADSVEALNSIAIDNIERMSTDMARDVAGFLYSRDDDIRYLASCAPDAALYRRFAENRRGRIVKPGKWALSADGKSWTPQKPAVRQEPAASSNAENNNNYHTRPADLFEYESRPLYLEITFIDTDGNEKIKVTTSPRMDKQLKNVSSRMNTYARAETYFAELKTLKPGEIYVSDVIGTYVRSRLIGMYNPGNAASKGLAFAPEKEAYAGRENPNGKRFQGIIRWAMPVLENGRVSGYVTFALDHDHIMEFADRVTPMKERYTELPSAFEGNYAFIWDYKCRNISHPRHHSIYGYNPDSGLPEIPWLEQGVYDDWQASGKPYNEFIKDYPVFLAQSRNKKPAAALTKEGLVGLDGRYLNHAPQCTGWFDLTQGGGSGSFLILWSGIWKPNTAATIPYYTGRYGATKRGFGFVAIGAGLEDFEKPARETEKSLNAHIVETNSDLSRAEKEAESSINSNLWSSALKLGASAGFMIILVVLIAIWMASVFTGSITRLIAGISRFRAGERQFRFNAPVKDELGILADSFDEMADSLVGSTNSPLSIIDIAYRIIYVNDPGLVLMGKREEEVVGRYYYDTSIFSHGSAYDPIKALSEGREAEVLFLQGPNRYLRGSASYLTDKEGRNIGYIITTTDVTEILEEQKRISQQSALLDTIFASSPDIIWYEDTQNKLLAVNPRYASIFGKAPGELVGKNRKDLLGPERFAIREGNFRKAFETRAVMYSEELFEFADGHREVVEVVITPLFDAQDKPMGLLGFARDVSSRVRIEQDLRTARENLEKAVNDANKANEYKGEFLARMSHEIRTPMNAIIGITNIVKKKLGEGTPSLDEARSNILQIEMSSMHLLSLLNDILDISKIEAGKIELGEEPVDILKLARVVESIIRQRCEEKKIRFNTGFHLDQPCTVKSDALRLRQVLLNLLGNAVKFTPENGTVDFIIKQKARNDCDLCLEFAVKDSGIGIPEEAMPHLFRPFEQASSQIYKQYGGTGLGLVISKSIVQLLGGDIHVESKEGQGSSFSFELRLPLTEEEKKETVNVQDAAGRLAGKRALIVDDVAINRMIAINLIEFTGLAIDEAADGQSAVDMFKESAHYAYSIIYMDVQMPGMDGYEASRIIRALDRPDAKTVPIVALTANAFKEDIDKALAAGMDAHLAKPMEMDKVLELSFGLIAAGERNRGVPPGGA